MPKTIQIRNVPDALPKKLKVSAAELGVTSSSWLLNIAERAVEQPTLQEMLKRLDNLASVQLDNPAEIVRRHRDARGVRSKGRSNPRPQHPGQHPSQHPGRVDGTFHSCQLRPLL